ncbi:hypothetical protein E3N88_13188 [Mikania micrantha]|uniref:Uncharacterized protein n=1 Tax=Mikania micrantha TaxID=192012 RepID=A0A5N6P8Z1_9ASTR|nr:hypothetical protein E3N88_13188 [Mikania micrantha]
MKSSISSSSSATHFLIYSLVIYLTSTIISGGNETDHYALLKIKLLVTHDPYGALASWNNSFHFCEWDHVYCGKRHRRVTNIRLESNGNLSSQLNFLSLYGNQLHGNLPTSIGNLVGLETLALDGNQLAGNIPITIGNLQKLQAIYLEENRLSGRIPDAMGNLSSLIYLQTCWKGLFHQAWETVENY